MTDKVRENRLRRVAERRGFYLAKSRSRDRRAIGYGCYWILDPDIHGGVIAGAERGHPALNLDEVEAFLDS